MPNLTLGSLFDGSGGFPLGGLLCKITPLWASEIEPFPIRVTTKRIPQMKHYGDISKLNGADLPPVDIITFGSPCTNMSAAGKREGLNGKESVLFYQAIRIIKEMRCKTNGKYPRYAVWENVPGAFSSSKGEDFKAVLDAFVQISEPSAEVPAPKDNKWPYAGIYMGNGWSVAYRTVDAQFFGVPQRRRRIYLVADFANECAGEILFECQGLSRNFTACKYSWQGTAVDAENSVGTASHSVTCLNDHTRSVTSVIVPVFNAQGEIVSRAESLNAKESAGSACHPPCVIQSSGFCTEHSAKSRGVGFEDERSPTLRAGVVPGVAIENQSLLFENHSQDSRYKGPLEQAPTVSSTYGTGGNNQPFVLQTPKTLKIRSGCDGGGKGALVQEDLSATLGCNNDQTVFVPTAYGICSDKSNSMLSANPNSGIYEAETARTLDANGGNPACNQGGIVVVEGNGSRPSHKGDGYKKSDVMYTLNTIEQHAVVYAIDRESYNCGQNYARKLGISEDGINSTLNAQGPSAVAAPVYSSSKASFFTSAEEELANTLVATDYKDPPIVNDVSVVPEYIVRRLTPTECARLQGFPDWWCSDLGTAKPTKEEIKWWAEVFETHRKIMRISSKPKSEKQIIKWLKNPHSDAAEYKMWGNGVALPCVCFVLMGIAEQANKNEDTV